MVSKHNKLSQQWTVHVSCWELVMNISSRIVPQQASLKIQFWLCAVFNDGITSGGLQPSCFLDEDICDFSRDKGKETWSRECAEIIHTLWWLYVLKSRMLFLKPWKVKFPMFVTEFVWSWLIQNNVLQCWRAQFLAVIVTSGTWSGLIYKILEHGQNCQLDCAMNVLREATQRLASFCTNRRQ